MPYVPSKKTDGESTDREILDQAIESLAGELALRIANNLSLIAEYKCAFNEVATELRQLLLGEQRSCYKHPEAPLAYAIFQVGAKYNYEGAYLGELNYAITRLIQRVPQLKVQNGTWQQEFRYWLYAATVEALVWASHETRDLGIGVSGVFEDIKDEYKRRVNAAYEAEQILKSGDCYDTSYYSRLVEVIDDAGILIGHQEIMLKRSDATLRQDVLTVQIVARKK